MPGIEPGPSGWEPDILATRPHRNLFDGCKIIFFLYLQYFVGFFLVFHIKHGFWLIYCKGVIERERELIRLLRRQPVWFGLEWDTPKIAHHKLSSGGGDVCTKKPSHAWPWHRGRMWCHGGEEKKANSNTPLLQFGEHSRTHTGHVTEVETGFCCRRKGGKEKKKKRARLE